MNKGKSIEFRELIATPKKIIWNRIGNGSHYEVIMEGIHFFENGKECIGNIRFHKIKPTFYSSIYFPGIYPTGIEKIDSDDDGVIFTIEGVN